MSDKLPLRIGLQQRVFPVYRAPFFDALARACAGGLSVFSGDPMPDETLGNAKGTAQGADQGMNGQLQQAQHVPAHNIYMGGGALLFVWQRGLIDWLERWQPDALIVEANPRNLSTNAALRWMHARHRPVIGWGLGAPPSKWHLPTPLEALLLRSRSRFLEQFDALVAYSQTGAEQFAKAGFPRARIFVARNAVTLRPTQPPPNRPPGYRGMAKEVARPTVLFVGRLQSRKRVDALLRACASLPGDLQPRLLIIGDGPARAEFETVARMVYPQAQFLGEKRDDALLPYFAQADLFVLPGTGGLAIQQAMSSALPVMVAEGDGTQADLVRAETGWLLPAQDDAALAHALADALADPARLRRMGQAAYRVVAEEINLENMVETFTDVLRQVQAHDHAHGDDRKP